MNAENTAILAKIKRHIRTILDDAFLYKQEDRAVVVFDTRSTLSALLGEGYAAEIPQAQVFDFDQTEPATLLQLFDELPPGSLVVLVQAGSFRLSEFRIRIELFKRQLKVIEHPHLSRIMDNEIETYVDALEYDHAYYRGVGPRIKARIDQAQLIEVESPGAKLTYATPFEEAKLNIGDYSGMKNIGGQFPIGEVFTEPTNIEAVNGEVKIFAFGDTNFYVNVPDKPFTLVIREGKVVDVVDAPPEFQKVLEQVGKDEELWIRELGFGMNRAFTRERRVSDIGSYERMCGIHLSLGAKHTIYNKPGLKRKEGKYHVDMFVDVTQVTVDGAILFAQGGYVE